MSVVKDTQAALLGNLRGEELRPPANSQHQFAGHLSEPPGKWILQPSDDSRPQALSPLAEVPDVM